MTEPRFLEAQWQAPPGVRALVSTRSGGFSTGPWQGLNLGDHVGDDPLAVARNRQRLREALCLPGEPQWLRQVHGTTVVDACADGVSRNGDAAWTDRAGVVCAVLTADCLPVVLVARDGSAVAVAHCGWRGLAAGVLRATVQRFGACAVGLRAWLGPAIGPLAFEVGDEVREAFLDTHGAFGDPRMIERAFTRTGAGGKYLADLYALARATLCAQGVTEVAGGDRCTLSEPECFYSYRREGVTGRMATLAWIDPARAGILRSLN
jgi:hypothetical protein